MGVLRDVEITWDDLLDAFENSDAELVFFLDRESGEVFSVTVDYEDEEFWEEIEADADRYLRVPGFGFDEERLLFHEFIKGTTNQNLKNLLQKSFMGRLPYGKLDEILTFYPEEEERLEAIKEEMTTSRIRRWLEENDIYFSDDAF